VVPSENILKTLKNTITLSKASYKILLMGLLENHRQPQERPQETAGKTAGETTEDHKKAKY